MNAPGSYPNPLLRGFRLPEGTILSGLWYRLARRFFQVSMSPFWKVRVFNRHYEPSCGSAVYISNHQSFLDPILMSFALRRPMSYMARDSLFHSWGFGQLIKSLNAFPVKRGTADTGAIKEAMRRLKKGGQVVLFPEGTRTRDGRIGQLLPGVAMLSQRSAQWTVPVVIDGAFEAWPRTRALPGPGSIVVQYGQPIPREEVRGKDPAEFVAEMRDILIGIQSDIRRRIGRPALEYD